MVAWNPDVPNASDNTPKWGGNSQPITRWEGDSSFGKLFEGVGNTLEIAAKGADYLVKHNIDEEAWNRINPEREAYTQTLEAGYRTAGGKVEQPLNITAPGTAPAPQAIERSLKYVQSVTAGVEAGKVNDTFYKGVLVNIAKDLRAQYPGYREYIDQRISSITGFDPANAKVNELITDINQLSGKKDSEKDHTLTDIRSLNRSGEVAGADIAYAKVRSGEWSPERGQQWIAEATKGIYEEKLNAREFNKLKHKDALSQHTASSIIDRKYSGIVAASEQIFDDAVGIESNTAIMRKIELHNMGKQPMRPEDLEAAASVLHQRAFNVQQRLDTESRVKNQHGLSERDILGDDAVNKKIEAAVKPMYDRAKFVSSGDLAAANSTKRENQARITGAAADLLKDPKLGPQAIAVGGNREVFGDNLITKMVEMNLVGKGLSVEVNAYIDRVVKNAAAQGVQPNPYGAITIKEQIDNIQKNKDKIHATTTAKALVDNISNILTSKEDGVSDELKKGLLMSIVHPEGRGLVGQFARDGMNKDGSWKPGQASIFNQLTSSLFTKEVRRITQNDPELWNQYTTWAKHEWGTEIFNKDIRELSSVTLPKGARLGWAPESKEFTLEYAGKKLDLLKDIPSTPGGQTFRGYETGDPTLRNLAPVLRKINMGLSNIKNIGEAEGKRGNELDAYVMRFLVDAGMRPLDPNATSIPQHMMNALYGPSLREILKKQQNSNEIQ